jgi:filamentous hemagglutinin family protein
MNYPDWFTGHLSEMSNHRHLLIGILSGFTALQPAIQAASSVPTGGTFTAGTGHVSAAGNVLTINQNSLKGIIDWNTFSIARGGTVNFNNGSGATLNRVNGPTPTTILGQLLATGSIYLLNPEGILIGRGATIHTGGDFLASTLNLPNSSFLSNTIQFTGNSTATVVNLGDLSATGGDIYLIGRTVQNGGSISAPNGTTGLAAGNQVLITDLSTNQKVAVLAPGGDVTNSGFINAAQVELKSNGGNIYALAGNNGGQINATGTAAQNGHIWLIATHGAAHVSGQLSAANADGTGGDIETSGTHVNAAGAQIRTGKGGNWLLDPDDLTIDSALAGTIETSLNGGTNVTEQTTLGGTGGMGDITVASSIAWATAADLTLSAYRNIGINSGVTISNTGAGNLTLRADNTSSTGIGSVAISGLVDFSAGTGNVAILYDPPGSEAAKYTTPVPYDIGTAGTQVKTNSAWIAPLDHSVSSQATAYMLVNNYTDLTNVYTNLSASAQYALGVSFNAPASSNFIPIANSGTFAGIFDGQGQTIGKLTVNDTTDTYVGLFGQSSGIIRNLDLTGETITGSQYVGGLVGQNNGVVANVASAGSGPAQGTVSLAAGVGYQPYIGGITGWNSETLINCSSTAMVSASMTNIDIYAGGIVGVNFGTVSTSYASGSVTITASNGYGHGGGLAGYNNNSISSSYATGNVNVGAAGVEPEATAGGLVGTQYGGTLTNTYATGTVTGGANVYAGGLVGFFGGTATSYSYASGLVTASTTGLGGGLFGNYGGGTVTSSYWDTTVTSQAGASGNSATISGATGEITATLKNGTLPNGFSSLNWIPANGFYPLLIWQEKLVAGDVFSGSSPLSAVTVDALANGVSIGSATTNGSGFYSFYVPLAYVAGASGVLTYLPGTSKGNTFSDGDGSGEYTGMNIYTGLLSLNNRTNSTYSGMLSALNSALGDGFSGSNFLFSPASGGNITLVSGANLSINSQLAFTLDKPINTSGTATIQSQGEVDQTDSITASALSLSGPGNFNLNQANSVGTLAANTAGYLAFNNSGNLIIGAASGVTGITAGGTVAVSTLAGNLTIAAGSTVTASGSGNALQFSTGNDFFNLDGSAALNVISDSGGRWLVFSHDPANDNPGALAYAFKQYAYADSIAQSTGNGFVYTISPILTVGLTNVSKTYDGTTSAVLSASNFTTSGVIDGDTISLITPTSGTYSNANAGTAKPVTATGISLLSSMNGEATVYGYQVAGSATSNIGTISPATLTYTANPSAQVYGFTNPAFSGSVSGFVDGQNSSVIGGAVWTQAANGTSNVGTYAIQGAGQTVNANYTAVQAAVNASALTITPALLNYIATPVSQTYGLSNTSFSGTVSGFVAGQTLATATSGTAFFNSATTAASNVGTYALNGSGLTANHGNYTFTQADANSSALTIDPATLTYTTRPVSQIYGLTNPSFTGTVTGFVNGQTQPSATSGTLAFISPATAASNVGTYAVNGTGLAADNGNYIFVQAAGNTAALTIDPALLTYTAGSSAARTYGSANPGFSGTVTGFVNGQTQASATSGTLAFTSPATAASNVGTYAVDGTGLAADNGNYTFTQAAGNVVGLTIDPALLTYTAAAATRAYGSSNPAFSGTLSGFVLGQTQASATTGTLAFNSPATTTTNIGSAAIDGSGLAANNGNYIFMQAAGNASALTVLLAAVTTPPMPSPPTIAIPPNILPTQASIVPPQIPLLLAVDESGSEANFLTPVNSLGLFQIDTLNTGASADSNNSFGASFPGFDTQTTPFAQYSFFTSTNDKPETFVAGAKP